ncbi:transcriptional regulator [Microbacterium sp. VKM Ac-2923]|uniref:transcriptional regulator n=1 Tax=Microbacterium sp. VKM Ac-2923 TaxID=2929476 RepID=UPI001FB4B826|nr:transcriptional regulator [Microbacterium sp. VKM Ac-2923]MCJ1709251.1 transcriptional regulator [Microbacterium sp. VKM Ac-2923]
MTVQYMSLLDVARHLDVSRDTVAKYPLPEPDVRVGSGINAARGWTQATIDAWHASRPGRGNWGARKPKGSASAADAGVIASS